MATDNEQLVLSISADTRQIQRQLKSLVGQTQANTKAIEDAFKGIDGAATGSFNRVAANSNKAFTTAEQGAKRYQAAMRASTVQTGNLAAQLNDIGVQLAGGQSPFLIALQQGTQITQALGSGVGVRGAVSAVAGAFTSLLNPVSLATIAIVALGGEAVQYFASLLSEGEKSEETLQKQAQLIQQVAKQWGDAVPALREYADELERTQQIAQLREGAQIVNENTLEATRAGIKDAGIAVADLVSQLQSAGEETEVIVELQRAFNDFASAANDGSLKVEDVQRVQDALAGAINSTGIPALDSFRAMFDQLAASALAAAGNVQKVNAATGAATTALYPSQGAYAGVDRSADGNIQNGGFMTPEVGPTPRSRPLKEMEGLPSGRKGGGGRSAAISDAEREKKAVADLIEQLEFEQSLIGMTDQEREVANTLRRAGAAATDEQRAKIEQLVEATYTEREALKANQDAMKELQAVGKDVLGGIVSDLRAGKSGADILANALDKIVDRLSNSVIDSLFSGLGTGGRGGLLGGFLIPGILHSGGVAGRDGYGHGRAVSSSTFRGARRYHTGGVAGLQPGEVPAILQRGEVVLPRGARTQGAGSAYAPTYNIDARGADQAAVARLERGLAERDRTESKRVAGYNQRQQVRKVRP
jgi:hypothetical protein